MRRFWWLFAFFGLGALVDLAGTVWNLSFIGYSFEGNPFIHNWITAVIVKVGFVVLLGFALFFIFDKSGVVQKFSIISLLLVAGVVQLFAGGVHLYIYSQYWNADQLLVSESGEVEVYKDGVLTDSFKPIVEKADRMFYYFKLVFLILLYPYLICLASFRLFLWITQYTLIPSAKRKA